ncbi:MAG TPA: hypothetical protein VEI47_00830, partial [Gemmatimonadales bacterium]|nr:hypothetical protein [Gemmatimonadales bacterium]
LLRGGQVEDIWLDESLSSLAEELGGRSFLPDTATFSNYVAEVVYDAYQYFANPGNNNLLQVADTILPEFGAGWLYARYLTDQFGPGITNQLEATTLTGTANVAFQTGLPFATTASRWALANYVSDLPGFAPPPGVFYRSWSFRATFGSLYQQDPVDFPIPFPLLPPVVSGSGVNVSGVLHSGSGFYVDVHQGPGAAAFTLHLAGPSALLPAEVVPRMSIIRIH